MNNHPFLVISDHCLTRKDATKELDLLLKSYGITNANKSSIIKIRTSKGETTLTYSDLLDEFQKFGYFREHQRLVCLRDPIWNNTLLGIACDVPMPINFVLNIAGYSKNKMCCPGRLFAIELELTEDILFYRKAVCENSNSVDYELSCRFYRAYLFSYMSLLEAFVNRHIHEYKQAQLQNSDFSQLKEERRLAIKLELLYKIPKNNDLRVLKEGIEWFYFTDLQKARNDLVHMNQPFFGLELRDLPDSLNKVREGIGGLLELIMRNQKKEPIAFIKKLKSAPLVTFVEQK